MSGKSFLDTNILIYAFARDDARAEAAEACLARGGAINVQVLNEFVSVFHHKLRRPWPEVEQALAEIRVLCSPPLPLTIKTHESGLRIAKESGYRVWDALVIASALEAGCDTLYSEDLHHGQVIEGLTIRNPFKPG